MADSGEFRWRGQELHLNKTDCEQSSPEKVFNCLTRRFGNGIGRAQIRVSFADRVQGEGEDTMAFLDALESLRSKGFPDEDDTVRRYEILQRFISGVRNLELHSALAAKYAEGKYVTEPPTEEELRYVAMEYVRLRKPRWEKTIFRSTPDLPAILDNPVESGPTIDIPTPAEPKPQDENKPPPAGIKSDECEQVRYIANDCPKEKTGRSADGAGESKCVLHVMWPVRTFGCDL